MTFSFSNSGPVQQVKDYLISTAEQYTDDAVHHVADLVHRLIDTLQAPHGVSVSVSGHGSPTGVNLSGNITALPDPSPQNPPTEPPSPVS